MKILILPVILSSLISSYSNAETYPISHLKHKGTQISAVVNGLTAENCASNLKRIYEEIFYTQPSQYDKAELLMASSELIVESFKTRQKIRQRVQELSQQQTYTPQCGDAVKRSLRALRAFEDYLGYLSILNRHELKLIPELSNNFELKSGDVLLSRGDAFTSATIARLGDEHLQFSHAALVYIDEAGKIFTIESHMEKGSVVAPIEEYFKDGKTRSTLYRQKDSKLAHEAAKLMFERVKSASETTGNIPYDIQMNLEDDSRIFCSETVRVAYAHASKGEFIVPMYMTKFSAKNRDLFDSLDSVATESFMPADLEADPRFELIMEWRDFSRINMAWTYDAIITKIFDWMENDGYHLHNTLKINVIKNLAFAARRTPIIKEKLKSRMSLDMTKDMISATAILYILVSKFEKKIKVLDENSIARSGYPLTITQQFEALETIKALGPKLSRAFRK